MEMSQKWQKNSGKQRFSGAYLINFGTLGESEWQEELSTPAMRQF